MKKYGCDRGSSRTKTANYLNLIKKATVTEGGSVTQANTQLLNICINGAHQMEANVFTHEHDKYAFIFIYLMRNSYNNVTLLPSRQRQLSTTGTTITISVRKLNGQ